MNTNTVEGNNYFYILNIKPNACPGQLMKGFWIDMKSYLTVRANISNFPLVCHKIKHILIMRQYFVY